MDGPCCRPAAASRSRRRLYAGPTLAREQRDGKGLAWGTVDTGDGLGWVGGSWVARPARRSSHGRTRRIDPVDRARRGSILAVNGRGPPTWESVRRHHRPSRPPQIASSAQLCSSNRTRARDSPPLSSSCSRRSAGLAHPPPPCSRPQHPRPAAAPPRAPSPNPSLAISPHCPGATTCPALRVAGGADRRHCLTEASESQRVGMRW